MDTDIPPDDARPSSLITTFPFELLSEIFLRYVAMYEAEEERGPDKTPEVQNYLWVPITHVCRHWRSVAIETPRIWSRIAVNSHPKWVREVLARSKNVPLVVVAWINGDREKIRELQRILKQLNRVCSLDLRIYGSRYRFASALLRSPAPLLRSLTVSRVEHLDDKGNPVFRQLLQGVPFRLEFLDIRSDPFIWDPIVFGKSLKWISLTTEWDGVNRPGAKHPTWAELFSALRSSYPLRELTIDNVYPARTNPPFQQTERFGLDIQKTILYGRAPDVGEFVRRTRLPIRNKISLKMKFSNDLADLHQVEGMIKEVFQMPPTDSRVQIPDPSDPNYRLWDRYNRFPIFTFAAQAVNPTTIQVRGWYKPLDVEEVSHITTSVDGIDYVPGVDRYNSILEEPNMDPHFSLVVKSINLAPITIFEDITPLLPFTNVRTLSVCDFYGLTDGMWTGVFERFRNVEILHISEWVGQELPEALMYRIVRDPVTPGQEHTTFIYPRLHTLVFEEVNFVEKIPAVGTMVSGQELQAPENLPSGADPEHPYGRPQHSFYFKRLFKCLKTREDGQCPVQKIVFSKCYNIRDVDLEALREYVKEVDYDGREYKTTGGQELMNVKDVEDEIISMDVDDDDDDD